MSALTTERLAMRPPEMDDFEGFAAFIASERSRFVGGPGRDRDVTWRAFAHLAGMWHLRGYGPFVVLLDGAAIGMAGPWRPVTIPEPELSYTLWSGAHEGRGLMTEAAAAAVRWSWARGLPSLVSYIDPANAPSIALARRLGAALDPAAEPSEPGVHVYRHPAPAARTGSARTDPARTDTARTDSVRAEAARCAAAR